MQGTRAVVAEGLMDGVRHARGSGEVLLVKVERQRRSVRKARRHCLFNRSSARNTSGRRNIDGQLRTVRPINAQSADGQIALRHRVDLPIRSEEHTSELQSLMRISYAVFCLNKKNENTNHIYKTQLNT